MAEWQAWIADRFGVALYPLRGVQSIAASPFRIVDNMSSASVVASGDIDLFNDIRPWGNELQLHRDGFLQWAGPINDVSFERASGSVTIEANDLLGWLAVRRLRGRVATGPLTATFAAIIEEAMRPDDIGLVGHAGFVSTAGEVRITDQKDALSEIIDLAPVIDFTMHGRDLLVGKEEVPFATLPSLVLPEMGDYTLTRTGSEEGTQAILQGGDDLIEETDTGRVTGRYPPTVIRDPNIGVVQRVFYDPSVLNVGVANTYAYSYWRYMQPPMWVVDADIWLDRTPFTLRDIVAGSAVPVMIPEITAFHTQELRVQSINVSWSATSGENVSLSLRPQGVVTNELG